MERQTHLFDPPPSQRHSETSQEAAEAIEPTVAGLRGRVLTFLLARGEHGATDEEIQVALEMNPSTERPRRVELWYAGLIVNSSETRLTSSGRRASIWVAARWDRR
jgi:hypothetical protein